MRFYIILKCATEESRRIHDGRDDGRGEGRDIGEMKGEMNFSNPLQIKGICS